MANSKKEFRIKVVENSSIPAPVQGAMGSVLPDGMILVRMYSDRPSLPDLSIHPIDEHGRAETAGVVGDVDSNITRTVVNSVVLTPIVARQLATWLSKHADIADSVLTQHTEVAEEND